MSHAKTGAERPLSPHLHIYRPMLTMLMSIAHRVSGVGNAIGTYLHGPLLPRNPWLADWLLGRALAHAGTGVPPALSPLPDELEEKAFRVSAERARRRGGKR